MKRKLFILISLVQLSFGQVVPNYDQIIKSVHKNNGLKSLSKVDLKITEGKPRLDSLIASKYFKAVYSYNASGLIETETDYKRDSVNHIWLLNTRTEYSYDGQGNRVKIGHFNGWDDKTQQWKSGGIEEYGPNGKIELSYSVSSSKQVIESSYKKWMYTYDSVGNLTSDIEYERGIDSLSWKGVSKDEYAYNSHNDRVLEMYSSYNGIAWRVFLGYKREFEYDENNHISLETQYNFDTDSQEWILVNKIEYTYSNDGTIASKKNYRWYPSDSIWVLVINDLYKNGEVTEEYSSDQYGYRGKIVQSYDTIRNVYDITRYNWNKYKNEWYGFSKDEFVYDKHMNTTTYASYIYDTTSNQWNGTQKTEFDMDTLVLNKDLSLPDNLYFVPTFVYKEKIKSFRAYSWDSIHGWILNINISLYYSNDVGVVTGVEEPLSHDAYLQVYPNPSQGRFTIDCLLTTENFRIRSLEGRILLNGQLKKGMNDINSGLSSGTYLLETNDQVKKLVVE